MCGRTLIHRISYILTMSVLVLWSFQAEAQKPTIPLSEEENKWLTEHRTLRLGVGVAFPPYMWVEQKDGHHVFKGMVSDYVDQLGRRLGVNMQIVFGIPFNEALDQGRTGSIDLFPCLSKTPERAQFLLFTEPYLSYPLVIITREDSPIVGGLKDLEGKRLAVVKHLFAYSKIKHDYPKLHLNYVFTDKVEENLEAVSLGRAEACIINLAAASYYIQKKGLTNLRIAAPVNWDAVQLSMGIRKDWPILLSIVEKALGSISQEEKDRISQRWIRAEYEPGVPVDLIWRWALGIGLGLGALFGLIFIWNRRLRREIVEKERAEHGLKESERKYKTLIEAVPDMVWEFDENEVFTFCSQSYKEILGYDPEALVGKSAYSIMPEADSDKLRGEFSEIKRERRPFRDLVNYNFTNNGELRCLLSSGVPIIGEDGSFQGYRGIDKDITEIKRMETQLQQAHKMEAVGTLAGGIAHDFNNILAVILGNTELAAFDVPDSNPAAKSLKAIHQASIRAKDMVQQLLAFSRKSDEKSRPFNMTPIIKESMKMLRSAVPSSVEFKQHLSGDLCNVQGDATQIHQIVMNLVTNAAHAMSDEGGLLEVALDNITLQEEKACFDWVLFPGKYVRLKVRDTGEGIAPAIIDRIFEPYYTTKEVGRGTGMGLSVVHGIVKRHGGGIRVESEGEKGTLFEIYFPALENAAEEEKKSAGKIEGGSERILFVDDEESLVSLNHQHLERLGYSVKSTTKPVEALEWFRADPDQFDVIITDMTMPRMTGDRLAAEVLKIRPHLSVIICTGYSERMSGGKAKDLGVRRYIEKPIDLRNLASALREVLEEG